ncbi:hypothetical protein D3C72_2562970 [compost metagenome]
MQRAFRFEIGRGGIESETNVADVACDQARILQGATTDRNVDAFLQQMADAIVAAQPD